MKNVMKLIAAGLMLACGLSMPAAAKDVKFTVGGVTTKVALADLCLAVLWDVGPHTVTLGVTDDGYLVIGKVITEERCRNKVKIASGGGGNGGGVVHTNSGATPSERVKRTYGVGVGYTNDTHVATAGSGGQQQAGDNVPTRTVSNNENLGGHAAESGEHATANGNEAPGFE